MKDTNFVTVGTFPDVSMAYLAKGRLEQAGIACFVAEENAGGLLLGIGASWPKLQVAEEDAVRAIAVLESHFGPEDEEAEDPPPEGAITARDQFVRFRDSEEAEEEANDPSEQEQAAADPLEATRTTGRTLVWLVLLVLVGPLVLGAFVVFAKLLAWIFG